LGLKIINSLESIGRGQGCYKIILDCSKDNIRTSTYTSTIIKVLTFSFLRKMRVCHDDMLMEIQLMIRFKHKEYQMVRYMEDPTPSPTGIPRSNSAKL
jgi:glucosamine-phosphate N-acetyltransferase